MAEYNLKENILNTTIADMVTSFSTDDLQREVPYLMEDLNVDVKKTIDEYQSLLASGKFDEASTYRSSHPELETRIFDAYKANSLMEKIAHLYLYSKAQVPQIVVGNDKPGPLSLNDEEDVFIGQELNDVWLRTNAETEYEPFDLTVRNADGNYSQFFFSPVLASNSDIDETVNNFIEGKNEVPNPNYSLTVDNLAHFGGVPLKRIIDKYTTVFLPNYYEPFKQSIVDSFKTLYPAETVPNDIATTVGSGKYPSEEKEIYASFVRNNFFARRSRLNTKSFSVLIDSHLSENDFITTSNALLVPDLPENFGEGALLLYAIIVYDYTIDHKEYETYERTTYFQNGAYNYTSVLGTYGTKEVRDYVCKAKLSKSDGHNQVLVNSNAPMFISNESAGKFSIDFKNNSQEHLGINTTHASGGTSFTSDITTYYLKNLIKFVMIY